MSNTNLHDLLKNSKLTLCCVESCTGGYFSEQITSISGASQYFLGGVVAYNNHIKETILGISKQRIEEFGVISGEIASDLAVRGAQVFHADICVSFTGNAGPGVLENKPVGLIYVAVYFRNRVYTNKLELSGDRNMNRKSAVRFAANIVVRILQKSITKSENLPIY